MQLIVDYVQSSVEHEVESQVTQSFINDKLRMFESDKPENTTYYRG